MVPSTFIWSKQVKPFAPSKRKHSHLETSTCNSITPSQTSRTLQHNTRCSSHTNSSTHCPFTFCKSVRYSCTLTHVLIFFENDRKKKQAGTNSSSPSNPQYPYPPHHPHPPPTPTLTTTSATFSPQHQQPLLPSSVFPLHDSATSPSVPRSKYHPSHSNSHVK